jgi:hypothetical protein
MTSRVSCNWFPSAACADSPHLLHTSDVPIRCVLTAPALLSAGASEDGHIRRRQHHGHHRAGRHGGAGAAGQGELCAQHTCVCLLAGIRNCGPLPLLGDCSLEVVLCQIPQLKAMQHSCVPLHQRRPLTEHAQCMLHVPCTPKADGS